MSCKSTACQQDFTSTPPVLLEDFSDSSVDYLLPLKRLSVEISVSSSVTSCQLIPGYPIRITTSISASIQMIVSCPCIPLPICITHTAQIAIYASVRQSLTRISFLLSIPTVRTLGVGPHMPFFILC
ncbi:hypothetical protein TNCV_4201321 [Trichonephila clavipes]|uniref:Uncharacterized protein n=1 Tax=Trichonephila clavipes TaxID=2585209 RepID=A0A8X6WB95_TRICX|nr:hypothetical protein TNCV_4201321 [Trichonephila clavipes]